jgi:hypothetical protein
MRDQTGHQFSFIFYGTASTAEKVFEAIEANSVLKAIKASGTVIAARYDDTTNVKNTAVKDTSDPVWPEALRMTWPYFIMGVSQTWLQTVSLYADNAPVPEGKTAVSVEKIMSFYHHIDSAVKTLWREQGGHAFLHHLNGIFGYEDVIVYEKRLMVF